MIFFHCSIFFLRCIVSDTQRNKLVYYPLFCFLFVENLLFDIIPSHTTSTSRIVCKTLIICRCKNVCVSEMIWTVFNSVNIIIKITLIDYELKILSISCLVTDNVVCLYFCLVTQTTTCYTICTCNVKTTFSVQSVCNRIENSAVMRSRES